MLHFQDLNRSQILTEAAREADALANSMGGAGAPGGAAGESEDGQLLREFLKDMARLSTPIAYPLAAEKGLKAGQLPVEVDIAELAKTNRFFLLRFPFDLQPCDRWSFNKVRVQVEFNPGAPANRPKVHAIFPNSQFKDLLRADASLKVELKPDLAFEAGIDPVKLQAGPAAGSLKAGITARAGASADFAAGPVGIQWKKAIIQASNPGLEWVWWELAGATLNHGDDPVLMAVLQVPADLAQLCISARMVVSRYYELFKEAFRNITSLRQVYREFLAAGVPYDTGPVEWDLTKEMRGDRSAKASS